MGEEHFSHEHPLTLQQWPEGKYCSGCKFPIVHGSVYKCWQCNFYLHEQCFKAQRYFNHPFHTTHPLNLHPKPTYPGRFFYCEICRQEGHGFSYSCSDCDFDLHVHCALAPVGTGGTGYSKYNYNYNYNYPQNTSGSYGGGNYNNQYPQNSTPSYGADYPAGYPPVGGHQYYGDNPQFHNNPSDYYPDGNEFPLGNQQSADYADQYDPESTDGTFFPQENFPNPATNQENQPKDAQLGQVSDSASDEFIANSLNNTTALSNELSQTDGQYHPVLETGANAPAGQYYSPQDGQSGPESNPNLETKVSRAGDEIQALSQDVEHFVHHTLRPYNVPQGDPVLCSVCNQKLSGSAYRCSLHLHESCFHLVEPEEEEEESGEHSVEASKYVAKSHLKICKHKYKVTVHELATKTGRRLSQQKDQSLLTDSEDESEEGAKGGGGKESETTAHEPSPTRIVAHRSVVIKARRKLSQEKDQSLLKDPKQELEESLEEGDDDGDEMRQKHDLIKLQRNMLQLKHKSETIDHKLVDTTIVGRKSFASKTSQRISQQNDPYPLKEQESKQDPKEEEEKEEEEEEEEGSKEFLVGSSADSIELQWKTIQRKHKVETIADEVGTKFLANKPVATKTKGELPQQDNQYLLKEEELKEGQKDEEEEMSAKRFVESSIDSIELQREMVKHQHKYKTIALESVGTKVVAHKSVATKNGPRISQRDSQSMLKEEESKEGQEQQEKEMSGKNFPESSTDSVGTKRERLSQQDDQYLLKGSEEELKEGPKEEKQEDSREHHVIASVNAVVLRMSKRLAQLVKNVGQNLAKFKIFFTFSSQSWEIFLTGLFLITQLIKKLGQNFAKFKLISNFYTFTSWGCKIFLAGLFLIAQLIKEVGQHSTKFKIVSGFHTFCSWGWKIFMDGFVFIAQSIKNVEPNLAKIRLSSHSFYSWFWKIFVLGLFFLVTFWCLNFFFRSWICHVCQTLTY